MWYRPLQLLTLIQAYATIASVTRSLLEVFPQMAFITVMVLFLGTLFGWLNWLIHSGQATHVKVAGLSIIVGAILGLWL